MLGLEDLMSYQETVRQSAMKEAERARKKGIKGIEDYLTSRGLLASGYTPEMLGSLEEQLLAPIETMETEFARQKLALRERLESEKRSKLANILKFGTTVLGAGVGTIFGQPGAGAGLGGALGSGLGALFGLQTGEAAPEELVAGLSAWSTEDLLKQQKKLYRAMTGAVEENTLQALFDRLGGYELPGTIGDFNKFLRFR